MEIFTRLVFVQYQYLPELVFNIFRKKKIIITLEVYLHLLPFLMA